MTTGSAQRGPCNVLVISTGKYNSTDSYCFLDQTVKIETLGCGFEKSRVLEILRDRHAGVDAIALDGWPLSLSLADAHVPHCFASEVATAAGNTPVVAGNGIRAGLQRWGIILAERSQPGIFSRKRTLMCPGMNHQGLAQTLSARGTGVHYADPVIFFGLPDFPGVGSRRNLQQAAPTILQQLADATAERLRPPAEPHEVHRHDLMFRRADIIAGDAATIRCYAPDDLSHKTVVVDSVSNDDIEDFTRRGVSILITMMPPLDPEDGLSRHSAAVVEAVLVALRKDKTVPLTEDTYLNMIAELDWQPGIRYLQPREAGINRFAFVIHPLSIRMIHTHPSFRWTRRFPDALVEWCAAFLPPMYVSKVTGARSPVTGQRVEGYLYALSATPRQMMRRGVRSTYRKLTAVARKAERRGARIMGLGAFTSVVGDAGKTVAEESDIAVTSGNSLTVAATLEAAKQAMISMGATDLTHGRAMVVGATGSIGAVCARLIAQAIKDVVLISIEPERLIELKQKIQSEAPGARVEIGTRAADHLPACDLVITATSAFGQRVVDISRCKPGAVVCDVARPHDISPAEAAVRPDVLVIDSGEVLIPGDIDFGYDIGLPRGVAYACLAETCLLAMDGKYVDYTIGRELDMDRVKEIYRLFKKHEFRIAGLHSFDEGVTEYTLGKKRALAESLRADPELRKRTMADAAAAIAEIPVAAKGVSATNTRRRLPQWLATFVYGFADRHVNHR